MTPYENFFISQLFACAPVTGHVVECCSGDGGLARCLRENLFVRDVTTNDIDETRTEARAVAEAMANGTTYEVPHFCLDARDRNTYATILRTRGPIDWIVTNPPFSQAIPILQAAMAYGRVAMLLRLSFLEPTQAREEFLMQCPPSRVHVMPRTSFTSDGKTDSVTVMWAVWDWTRGSIGVAPRRETWESAQVARRRARP